MCYVENIGETLCEKNLRNTQKEDSHLYTRQRKNSNIWDTHWVDRPIFPNHFNILTLFSPLYCLYVSVTNITSTITLSTENFPSPFNHRQMSFTQTYESFHFSFRTFFLTWKLINTRHLQYGTITCNSIRVTLAIWLPTTSSYFLPTLPLIFPFQFCWFLFTFCHHFPYSLPSHFCWFDVVFCY